MRRLEAPRMEWSSIPGPGLQRATSHLPCGWLSSPTKGCGSAEPGGGECELPETKRKRHSRGAAGAGARGSEAIPRRDSIEQIGRASCRERAEVSLAAG